jgi:hypothetical protein
MRKRPVRLWCAFDACSVWTVALAVDDAPWVPRNERGIFARVSGACCVIATCRHVQLLRNESDEKPVLIDTGMRITNIRWNNSGEPVGPVSPATVRR